MVDRKRMRELLRNEEVRFEETHPLSKSLYKKAQKSLYNGVPMNWMVRWASPFPIFVEKARGAIFSCVDGKEYLDFCLGDTGAMTGHAPPAAVGAICERIKNGTTFMLPTADAIAVGEELRRRFGLPYWQLALTATDANRFAIRLARQMTGRKKILVFNWCYHGKVDEVLDRYMHLATLNRGILMTPFHNMALIAPTVTKADIDRHTDIFREIVAPLVKKD